MKHVVFMTHDDYIPHDAAVARVLRRRAGLGSVAVVHGRRNFLAATGEDAFDRVVDIVEGFRPELAAKNISLNIGILSELEAAARDGTIMQDIVQDRWLFGRHEYPVILEYLAHTVRVIRELIVAIDIAAFVGELTRASYRVARRASSHIAPYFYPLPAKFYPRFCLEDGLYYEWRKCVSLYERYMADGIPEDVLGHVEGAYRGTTEELKTPALFSMLKKHPGTGSEPLGAKLRLGRLRGNIDYWLTDFPERRRNPMMLQSAATMMPHAKIRRWAGEWKKKAEFRRLAAGRLPAPHTFSSYFLHYQPEYTVDGVGFVHADQPGLIRAIAQSLPVGHVLAVKEQPFMLGLRPKGYYESILRIPNVVLVDEGANSREMIRNSAVVFTICGTASLEALFMGVPSVVFSNVFHSHFKGVARVLDLYSLGDIVHGLLAGGHDHDLYRQSAYAALAAMYNGSYAGELMTTVVEPSHILRAENIEKIAGGIVSELHSRGIAGALS